MQAALPLAERPSAELAPTDAPTEGHDGPPHHGMQRPSARALEAAADRWFSALPKPPTAPVGIADRWFAEPNADRRAGAQPEAAHPRSLSALTDAQVLAQLASARAALSALAEAIGKLARSTEGVVRRVGRQRAGYAVPPPWAAPRLPRLSTMARGAPPVSACVRGLRRQGRSARGGSKSESSSAGMRAGWFGRASVYWCVRGCAHAAAWLESSRWSGALRNDRRS
jgi:hypothetical protein